MKALTGNLGTLDLNLPYEGTMEVRPRCVVTLVARGDPQQTPVRLAVGAGSGVHLVVPRLYPQFELETEVSAGAQFTVSVVGEAEHEHAARLKVKLVGEGATVHIQLAALGKGSSNARFDCVLEHAAPGTTGRIVVRRIQRDNSTSHLKGMLSIAQGANKTDTYLSDKVLLMGEKAHAVSDPQLEILADDVRASHGATIGRLNEEELFYIRSRGLSLVSAQTLLMQAFLVPALIGVPQSFHAGLQALAQ